MGCKLSVAVDMLAEQTAMPRRKTPSLRLRKATCNRHSTTVGLAAAEEARHEVAMFGWLDLVCLVCRFRYLCIFHSPRHTRKNEFFVSSSLRERMFVLCVF